jgi:hypothetical protein
MILYNTKNVKNSYHLNANFILANKHTRYFTNYKSVIIYKNFLLHKHNVLKENKDKSGVYKLINRINNESYVGSSTNISKRLREYYCLNYLQNKMFEYNSRIYKALLNYGHKNFDLEILEYCDASLIICREQYYLDLLEPEYNICKTAGSMLGFKH